MQVLRGEGAVFTRYLADRHLTGYAGIVLSAWSDWDELNVHIAYQSDI